MDRFYHFIERYFLAIWIGFVALLLLIATVPSLAFEPGNVVAARTLCEDPKEAQTLAKVMADTNDEEDAIDAFTEASQSCVVLPQPVPVQLIKSLNTVGNTTIWAGAAYKGGRPVPVFVFSEAQGSGV